MNDNCITRFEVSNFKKFDHLVVENLGQVNLVTGDNNVGKTTLLEALLCNEDNRRWISYLHQMLYYRGIHINAENLDANEIKLPEDNFLYYIVKDLTKKLICRYSTRSGHQIELALKHKTITHLEETDLAHRKDKYNVANARDWVVFYKNGIVDELQWLYYDDKETRTKPTYWPYTGIDTPYSGDIRRYEQSLNLNPLGQTSNEFNYSDKKNIIRLLNIINKGVVDYEYVNFGRNKIHGIATETDEKYRPITTFGDGFQKYFRYVWQILFADKIGDNRFMIDEIDTGVHYLRMKDEWKAIFELSKQTGIQIFATTHSMDCIKAFVEAGEEVADIRDDLRLIELEEFTKKDGSQKHTAKTYDFELVKYNLQTETNIRGGDVWR